MNYCLCEANTGLNCGSLVKSSCTDDLTTKWNRNDIGRTLKMWLGGITKITSIEEQEKEYFFLRKTVVNQENQWNRHIIKYIANLNCSNQKHFGPTWRKAGVSTFTRFHDGLLYGIEDENGTLTGCGNIITKHLPTFF